MREVRIMLADDEYIDLIRAKGSATNREVLLRGAGLEAEPHQIGRPTKQSLENLVDRRPNLRPADATRLGTQTGNRD